MADKNIPYFRNDTGVETIQVGASGFMCTGASTPFDHPHIFLDMGKDDTIICPYCSTRFQKNANFSATQVDPAECAYNPNQTI
ncbi:MAG: zinc-finger domain-containing protein [Alphaproteobacteria bacterium]